MNLRHPRANPSATHPPLPRLPERGQPRQPSNADNIGWRMKQMLRAAEKIADSENLMDQFPSALISMPRPTRIFRPANITPAAQLAPGATIGPVQVRWPQSCFVVGITWGTLESTAAALGAMSCRIQVEASLDLFTDGQAGAFAHPASLANTSGIGVASFFPFIRWADQSTQWQVTVKNEDPGGGTSFTPVVQFLIVDPRDLPGEE